MINIALDGPAGAGKSWLAHTLAEKLGFIHVDTGALYRSIGLYMSRCGIAPEDKAAFVNALDGLTVELGFENGEQRVYLCGEDVTGLIRTPEISMYASAVSSVPEVRAFLLETQRRLARENNVIMDGRDIGTVILPLFTDLHQSGNGIVPVTGQTQYFGHQPNCFQTEFLISQMMIAHDREVSVLMHSDNR